MALAVNNMDGCGPSKAHHECLLKKTKVIRSKAECFKIEVTEHTHSEGFERSLGYVLLTHSIPVLSRKLAGKIEILILFTH